MSQYDSIWRSLDDTVARGYAPGIVAGIRHGDDAEFYAAGCLSFDSSVSMETTTPFRIASLSKPFAGAIAALMIDDGILRLDDPVERWLPELAKRRVLKDPAGALSRTLVARRPITVEHLLTLTNGLGLVFEPTPLSKAIAAKGVGPGAIPPQLTPDQYMARVAELPLAYQPGARFMYSIGTDILSVLLARAAGKPLSRVVQEMITDPLGMTATGFSGEADELPTMYLATPDGIETFDEPDGYFSRPPLFETLAAGIVSTVPDYFKFLSALADGTFLPRAVQAQMVANQLTDEQRVGAAPILDDGSGWGWQVGVRITGTGPGRTPGSFGWQGGSGTTAFVDPQNDLVACAFTQRMMAGPADDFGWFTEPLATLL